MVILPRVYIHAKHIPLFLYDARYRIPHWSTSLSLASGTLNTSHPWLTNQKGIVAMQPLFKAPLPCSEDFAHHFKALSGIFFPKSIPEGPGAYITYP